MCLGMIVDHTLDRLNDKGYLASSEMHQRNAPHDDSRDEHVPLRNPLVIKILDCLDVVHVANLRWG